MLDTFITLTEAAGKIGKVTAASLYPSGFICIDIASNDGKNYQLSYSGMQKAGLNNGNP